MVTYQALRAADFGSLAGAVEGWRRVPEQFEHRAREFTAQVCGPIGPAVWRGEASDAAQQKMAAIAEQLRLASGEARDVHAVLLDAHETLTALQKKLNDYAAHLSTDPNLTLNPATGHVTATPRPPALTVPDQPLLTGASDAATANRYIAAILAEATEADENLRSALERDANGRDRGFSNAGYGSLEAAETGRDRAERDATAATALAGIANRPLTEAELRRLNTLLARHEGDPDFAERFALSMGPKRTLEFWARNAAHAPPSSIDELTRLQKSLGFTLATATQSSAPAMERWERRMTALGNDRVSLQGGSFPGSPPPGPYGFQVMSALLRNGEYETDFLQDYGRSLIDFEQDWQSRGVAPETLWRTPAGAGDHLTFGHADSGTDPFPGYLEALGHNPTAATSLFDNGSSTDPDLEYLLKHRTWFADPPDNPRSLGHDELGHALEAATLGVPHGEVGLERSDAAGRVMGQVVHSVAKDAGFLDARPGLSDSVARMGAGYIDDLNWSLADDGGNNDLVDRGALYGHERAGHLDLRSDEARAFLSTAARGEMGHAILSAAQSSFTANAMSAYPHDPVTAQHISDTGAYAHGAMDGARILDIEQTYHDQAERQDAEAANAASWKKYGVSQGLGAGAGLAVLPFAGPGAAAVTTVAVPMVVEAGVSAIDELAGQRIDAATHQTDYTSRAAEDASGYRTAGLGAAKEPTIAYYSRGGVSLEDGKNMLDSAANAYDRGSNDVGWTSGKLGR
ncbi:hypothetical protein AB0M28_15080 [Streptomyces sp. NPDC051940]|uniref:hypothetical protein n=1 Tax=Streptomyces sp. NPDC051940 TaxID=3155675 RepID=UPI003433B6D1